MAAVVIRFEALVYLACLHELHTYISVILIAVYNYKPFYIYTLHFDVFFVFLFNGKWTEAMSIEKYTTDQSKSTKQHLLYKHKIHGKSIFFLIYKLFKVKKKKKRRFFFYLLQSQILSWWCLLCRCPFPPFFFKIWICGRCGSKKKPKTFMRFYFFVL